MKILIVGLGQIGFADAEYLKSVGVEVDGYDVDSAAVERAVAAKVIQRGVSSFAGYDVYVICVSTHNPKNLFEPLLNSVYDVVEKILVEGKQGSLISVESTVPVGTVDTIAGIAAHEMHVVHVPHRYDFNSREKHGVNQLRVLGGYSGCCCSAGEMFYSGLLKIPLHLVKSAEVAELSKIVENTYRFVQIGFAEELKLACDENGVDFSDLAAAVNTKWNVEILEPRTGIGGHCLPKDSEMYLHFFNSSIVRGAKRSDARYRDRLNVLNSSVISPSDVVCG